MSSHIRLTTCPMTRRARAYLLIVAVRHGVIGLSLLWLPWMYTSAAFIPVFNLLPLWTWGLLMVLTSGLCGTAAVLCDGRTARIGMVSSATITLVIGVGISIGVAMMWVTWVSGVGWERVLYIAFHPVLALPPEVLVLARTPASPFLPMVLLAVSAKDMVVCAQPMQTPFEDSITKLMLEDEGLTGELLDETFLGDDKTGGKEVV